MSETSEPIQVEMTRERYLSLLAEYARNAEVIGLPVKLDQDHLFVVFAYPNGGPLVLPYRDPDGNDRSVLVIYNQDHIDVWREETEGEKWDGFEQELQEHITANERARA